MRRLLAALCLLVGLSAEAQVRTVWTNQAATATTAAIDTGRAQHTNIQITGSSVVGTVAIERSNDCTTWSSYLTLTDPANEFRTVPSWACTRLVFTRTSGTVTLATVEAVRTGRNGTMVGATSGAAGVGGLVPLPAAGDQAKALLGDGTWGTVSGGSSSPLTTKGDVWGFSTVDARLPVGTNGFALFADSSETLGVKWAAVTGTLSGLTANAIPYASSATALADSPLIRVDANTIDQQNGANAQTFQLYNTYSGAGANYERGGMQWVGNEFKMGTFAPAGTGAARYAYITGNGTDVAYWNASIWAFNANVNLPVVTIQQSAIFGDTPWAKPTCSVDYRGWTYTNHGASNVADTIEPCLKSADGTYAWQTMATGYGLVPTAPAGGGTCGTGTPALNADAQDAAGQLTVGGGSPTSCAITFGKTYAVAPSCTANGSATAGILVATTTSTVTLSATALGAGEVLHYVCGGFR